ncbi:fatty acid desaturase [Desulfopila aestuarii]|uniref:Omega-6 fatty acid desaturase (Delta-12 desaturase) n=1 Tax=Desulfopila aestuarii DSM 18488 TaxID=1121416 RepID=A0A1M7XYU2_9BACT|nr:fatty acid desaturase [Desulfopila aestuarii]SHO44216.1 omega-6 fatty acid desaturase (delta-12 desaturase) [Desulfopila aestuarii DSM 18488]
MTIDTSNNVNFSETKRKPNQIWPDWCEAMRKFRASNNLKATWQIINTIVPYFCLWYLTIRSIQHDYPSVIIILLIITSAAFLVRIFILFHDCVHYSFFQSKNANIFFGYFFSLFLFISFADWRFTHLRHHGKYANLDSRGYGDVWTMTKKEYENTTTFQRIRYRLFRNPLVLFGLGIFLLSKRPSYFMVKTRERIDVLFTYLLISAIAFAVSRIIGWSTYFLIQLPVLWLAGGFGIWLFYVNHQFEGVYWARRGEWNPFFAAMKGSSFFKLPAVLNWLTSNIGYHHVHHLDPRIPNYHLQRCYNTVPELQNAPPVTVTKSVDCFRLKLWDEDLQKMVPFPC